MIPKSVTLSNKFCFYFFSFSLFLCYYSSVLCADPDKCYLSNPNNVEEGKLLDHLSPIMGQTFRVEKDGYNYTVAICSDTSKLYQNVSVTKSKYKGETIFLGRRNESHLVGEDAWVMLRYECNKCPNSSEGQCIGHRSTSIFIVCDPHAHNEYLFKLAGEDECHYNFLLSSEFICNHDKKNEGTSVFLILLPVGIFMYFIVGIIYRRLAKNAQGCHHLPHFRFWQTIGAKLADCCNFVCRCDSEAEDSWNNITSNFDNGDRDDALLRP